VTVLPLTLAITLTVVPTGNAVTAKPAGTTSVAGKLSVLFTVILVAETAVTDPVCIRSTIVVAPAVVLLSGTTNSPCRALPIGNLSPPP